MEAGGEGSQARQAGPAVDLTAEVGRSGRVAAAASTATWAIVAVVVMLVFAAGTGRYGGPDEPAHVLRAAAVASGDWRGDPVEGFAPGFRAVTVPGPLATGDPGCYRLDPTTPAWCAFDAVRHDGGPTRVATSAGINPPWWYLVVGLPVRIAGQADDAGAYRVSAALLHALLGLVLVGRARSLGSSAVLGLAAVGAPVWFLLGVANPNTTEIVLLTLAWTEVARRLRGLERSRSDEWFLLAPLVAAVAIRPIAIAPMLTVLAVLALAERPPVGRRIWLARAGAITAAALSWLAWDRVVGAELTDPRTARDDGILQALLRSVGDVPRTLWEASADLGWAEYHLPVVFVTGWSVVLGAALVAQRHALQRRALAVVVTSAVVAPILFEVAFHGRLGPIWQGRYSIPMLLGIGAVLAAAPTPTRRLTRSVVAVQALVGLLTFLTVVRRTRVGTDGSWWPAGAVPGGFSSAVDGRLLLALVVLTPALAVAARRRRGQSM
jgi:hypothetical protein